jgi:hypothetical protein
LRSRHRQPRPSGDDVKQQHILDTSNWASRAEWCWHALWPGLAGIERADTGAVTIRALLLVHRARGTGSLARFHPFIGSGFPIGQRPRFKERRSRSSVRLRVTGACSGGCGSSCRSRQRNPLGRDHGGLRPLALPIPRAVQEQRCRSFAELIPSGRGCLSTGRDNRPDMPKRRAAQHPYWQTPAPPAKPG